MSGLVQDATQSQSQGKGVDLNALKTKIDATIPKEQKRGYNATMAAGMKLMFSEKTFPEAKAYLDQIQSPDQIPDAVGHGIVKGMSILMNESKGRLPIESSAAAAQGLMTQALDYLQSVKGITITNDIVAKTTQAVNQGMMHLIKQYSGLNDDQFNQILQGKAKDLIQQDLQAQGQPPTGGEAPPMENAGA